MEGDRKDGSQGRLHEGDHQEGAHDKHSVHVLDLPFPLGTLGHVFNDHLHVGAHDNHPVHVRP